MSNTTYSIGPGVVIKKRKNPTGKKVEKRYKASTVSEGGSLDDLKNEYRLYDRESTEVVSDVDSELTVEWVLTNGSEYTVTYETNN